MTLPAEPAAATAAVAGAVGGAALTYVWLVLVGRRKHGEGVWPVPNSEPPPDIVDIRNHEQGHLAPVHELARYPRPSRGQIFDFEEHNA